MGWGWVGQRLHAHGSELADITLEPLLGVACSTSWLFEDKDTILVSLTPRGWCRLQCWPSQPQVQRLAQNSRNINWWLWGWTMKHWGYLFWLTEVLGPPRETMARLFHVLKAWLTWRFSFQRRSWQKMPARYKMRVLQLFAYFSPIFLSKLYF